MIIQFDLGQVDKSKRANEPPRVWKIDIDYVKAKGDCDNCKRTNVLVFSSSEHITFEVCATCVLSVGLIYEL